MYFCVSVSWTPSWVFKCAFMGISWAIRTFITHEIYARLEGHEMYRSKIYVTCMTHDNPFSWLCKRFMVHENNW